MTNRASILPAEPASSADPSGRAVFEILAREHAPMLLAFLRSLLRAGDAVDDVFQETMLTAWRRLADYDRERPFAPWLRGIALNLVRKQQQRDARVAVPCDPAELEALVRRFDEVASTAEVFSSTSERLQHCLRHLPEKLRVVIGLVYERGLALRAAAQALETNEEAVKKRVQRGRQMLAACLRRGGVVA